MDKIKRVAGYARVSHEEQRDFGFSIDAQIEEIKKWCDRERNQLFNLYVDEGFSAKNMKRPQLQELLNNLDNIDIIVFTKLDRFTRNVLEANKMIELFNSKKVSLVSISEGFIDTRSANGLFMFNFNVNIAQHELNRNSERISAVIDYKVRQGHAVTGSVPFGYKIETIDKEKRVVKDTTQAFAVEKLFEHFLYHQSVSQTLQYLQKEHNFDRGYQALGKILRNKLYTGVYRDNLNYTEPYISIETFNKIQEILKRNIKTHKTRRVYIFSGLVKCCNCGNLMSGASIKCRGYNAENYYYRCNNYYINKTCHISKMWSELKIEKYLLDNIEDLVKKEIVQVTKANNRKTDTSLKRQKELKEELNNLNYMFLKKRISQTEYDNLYNEVEVELLKIKTPPKKENIKELQNLLDIGIKIVYEKMDRKNKQAFWRSVLKEIHIKDDYNIKIVFTNL